MTPLDALVAALRGAGEFMAAAEAAPETIVWCDAGREFAPVLPLLRARLPNLLTLGEYDPELRTGPALWLRTAIAGLVPGVRWSTGDIPILYLPGIPRDAIRGAEECPEPLRLLVWPAVVGAFFGQPKQARDWTLRGFLAAAGSPVGLDVPEDATTRTALAGASRRLFSEPVSTLTGRRWDATALNGLLVEDADATMLAWLDGVLSPTTDPDRFTAFATLSTKRYGFDPRKRSREDAAALLATRAKGWAGPWNRFAEFSSGYDEVVRLLGLQSPADLLAPPESYPSENRKAEASLRSSLLTISDMPLAAARSAVKGLEADHGWRRGTVWARRGEAKLAQALLHLARVGDAPPLPMHDAAALAEAYVAEGWHTDAAAVDALSHVDGGEDRKAVVTAMRALYTPWLNAGAQALQALASKGGVPFAGPAKPGRATAGDLLLFVDGLRMDVAHRLADLLRREGASVEHGWCWSGFPTITATCKPLVSPAAELLKATSPQGLEPAYGGKPAAKPVLMKAVEAAGWSIDDPPSPGKPSWLEGPSIDKAGEKNQGRMLPLLPGILSDIVVVVMKHARAGRRVRIVTDHGFVLMPGGLPKAELPATLVEPSDRARRVALLKEGAVTSYALHPWTWDPGVLVATAPGVAAFYANVEYAHGGVSPQECVLPVLDVTAEHAAPRLDVTVRWRRLMAKVQVKGGSGLMVDLRVGEGTSGPSALLKAPKLLDDAGEANVGIDDIHEGKPLCVVIYRQEAPDTVLAMLRTRTGE